MANVEGKQRRDGATLCKPKKNQMSLFLSFPFRRSQALVGCGSQNTLDLRRLVALCYSRVGWGQGWRMKMVSDLVEDSHARVVSADRALLSHRTPLSSWPRCGSWRTTTSCTSRCVSTTALKVATSCTSLIGATTSTPTLELPALNERRRINTRAPLFDKKPLATDSVRISGNGGVVAFGGLEVDERAILCDHTRNVSKLVHITQ